MVEHLFKNWMVYVLMGGFVWFVISIYRSAKRDEKKKDAEAAKRIIDTILESYLKAEPDQEQNKNKEVIATVRSFAKRGRLTMQGDEPVVGESALMTAIKPLFVQHNKARLKFDKNIVADLRKLIVAECDEYLEKTI